MNKIIKQKNSRKFGLAPLENSLTGGFTLVETLVAVTILLVTISAAFSAVSRGLSEALLARDNITSYYLAREAVEYIKNQRDYNNLIRNNWLSGIANVSADPCYIGKKCIIDAVNSQITECVAGLGCPVIQSNFQTIDSTDWAYAFGYGTTGWTNTKFTREITVTPITTDEISVVVKISWNRGGTRTFTVQDNVYNWQK